MVFREVSSPSKGVGCMRNTFLSFVSFYYQRQQNRSRFGFTADRTLGLSFRKSKTRCET